MKYQVSFRTKTWYLHTREDIFHSFAALTREIFVNTRREISYLRAAM